MFNKTAAEDGNIKLRGISEAAQKSVDCGTSHSRALWHCPALQKNVHFNKGKHSDSHCEWTCERMPQEEIEKYVRHACAEDIHDFVLNGRPPPADSKGERQLVKDEELCAFWIYKTWLTWVCSAGYLDALEPTNVDPQTGIGRMTYYPAVANYKGEREHERLAGTKPGTFYTSQAKRLWERMMRERTFVTDDAYLKYVQLSRTALERFDDVLLDESQDLTECQIELFVVNQPQADVYIVGDAVQSLYSWRGAKPKQLRELRSTGRVSPREVKEDLQLTLSHRFGAGIARIANHLLFIKRFSDQHKLWHHYEITAAGQPTVSVSDAPLRGQRTVVGRTNAGLIGEAFELLAEDPSIAIALLGKSSYARFDGYCAEVLQLLPHYKSADKFGFKRRLYDSWEDFEQEVEDREMPYGTHLALLGRFASDGPEQGELPALIDSFRSCVLERKVDEHSAEVILATACGAKGLEWDNVKVLDDYIRLMTFEAVPADELQPHKEYAHIHSEVDAQSGPTPATVAPAPLRVVPMRFKLTKDYKGDELNNWYVAVTRARKRLQLPPRFMQLHTTLWKGVPFQNDPTDKNAPEYTAEEINGINALLAHMRRKLPQPGAELDASEGGTASSSNPGPGPSSDSSGVAQAATTTSPSNRASAAATAGRAGFSVPTPSSAMRGLHFCGS